MYFTRLIEKNIRDALDTSGVVVVAGPKSCGKTTTSKLFAKSQIIIDTKAKIELVSSDPYATLDGENPRLVDEWQNVPDLWNAARTEIDKRDNKFGQFIFTGSSTPADKDEIFHSGAGRIVTLKMSSMSLYESNESKGSVSIKKLFEGKEKVFDQNEEYSLKDTAFYICRGGWPLSVTSNKNRALQVTSNYISTLFEFENNKNKKFRNKKKNTFITLLKSYARNVSTEARKGTIIKDISEHEDRTFDRDTFDEYKEALEDLFIIRDIDSWNPNFRSKTSIVTSPTLHFVDTSIATGILKMSPDDLMNDAESFGFLFEDFAIKELITYVEYLGGEVRHYRDSSGLECDAILHLDNGEYALCEIKLGGNNLVEEGVCNLMKLNKKIEKEAKMKKPSFMMIVTACGLAYTTKEGVHIVPINLLKP